MEAILKQSPSPPTNGLFGHLPAFVHDPLGFLTDCARNYSGVVPLRMAHKPAFLLLDPADIERVLVTDHRSFIKPAWLRTPAVQRLLGDGLVTSEGDDWHRQRHACQAAFQLRRMARYGEEISKIAEHTLEFWETGQTIDLLHEMALLTLEIVGRVLFEIEDSFWTAEAASAMDILMARFTAGRSLFGMISWLPGPQEIKATRQMNRVVDQLILLHEKTHPSQNTDNAEIDLLTMFRHSNQPGEEKLGGRALREQAKTFLTAGHESSALALTWAFLLLAQNPDVEVALAAELAEKLNGRPPRFEDAARLPYTLAIVQEALRLYPPLWMTGRESAHTCEIGGVVVPGGALVMTSQWAVQRLANYFPRPEEFLPERWLNGETTDLPRCAYFPFGAGPRICIAQSFAMMETTILLAAIAQRFRLEKASGPEIVPCATMTLRPQTSIQMTLRSQSPLSEI